MRLPSTVTADDRVPNCCYCGKMWQLFRTDVVLFGTGLVGEVVPRKSELADPPIANVDHVLLVFAVDQPPVRSSGSANSSV